MREIKFRGRGLYTNVWVYGDLIQHYNGTVDISNKDNVRTWDYEVDPATVGQYTGLRDYVGREVYEGDIVRCRAGERCQGFWEYDTKITISDFIYDTYAIGEYEDIEVIGNIYENSELVGTD